MLGLCVVVSLNTLQLPSSALSSIQRPHENVCWVVQELIENSIICEYVIPTEPCQWAEQPPTRERADEDTKWSVGILKLYEH